MMVEPVIGLYGLRTFRLSLDMHLVPLSFRTTDWQTGRCVAQCRSVFGLKGGWPAGGSELLHAAPDAWCSCGIYASRTLAFLRQQYSAADDVIAVVAVEGRTLEGDHGYRSHAARVVALHTRPGLLNAAEMAQLAENLPGVRFHNDVDEMIDSYPNLAAAAITSPPAAPQEPAGTDKAIRRDRVLRWLLPLLAAAAVLLPPGAGIVDHLATATPLGPLASTGMMIIGAAYAAAFFFTPQWRRALSRPVVLNVLTLPMFLLFVIGTNALTWYETVPTCLAAILLWTALVRLISRQRPRPDVVPANLARDNTAVRLRWNMQAIPRAPRLRRNYRHG